VLSLPVAISGIDLPDLSPFARRTAAASSGSEVRNKICQQGRGQAGILAGGFHHGLVPGQQHAEQVVEAHPGDVARHDDA
jgi:hypothetical protein